MPKTQTTQTIQPHEKAAQIIQWIDEKKGLDLFAIDISSYQTITEALCIATATSTRHAQGLCDFILEQCKVNNYEFLRTEGYTSGTWILIDLNDVVVHLFLEETRELFRLQDLWSKARIISQISEKKG